MRELDAHLLLEAVRRDFPGPEDLAYPDWNPPPPVRLVDCVLSLNRPYDTVVAPRIEAFQARFPAVLTCADLRAMIDSYDTPTLFLREALDTGDARRAKTLSRVLDFLIDVQRRFPGATEEERLAAWARDARPGDYLAMGIPHFALAGFQYLRMLLGAETVKPDVHIIRYVSDAVGRPVSDAEALYIVELAATTAGLPVRGLDHAIWKRGARGG